jgi:hypothetical protein
MLSIRDLQTLLSLSLNLPLDSLLWVDSWGVVGVLFDEEIHDLSADDDETHEYRSGGETGDVSGSIGLGPEEDTVDGCAVTHTVDEGDSDCTFLSREGDDIWNLVRQHEAVDDREEDLPR